MGILLEWPTTCEGVTVCERLAGSAGTLTMEFENVPALGFTGVVVDGADVMRCTMESVREAWG